MMRLRIPEVVAPLSHAFILVIWYLISTWTTVLHFVSCIERTEMEAVQEQCDKNVMGPKIGKAAKKLR
jgi:hypothetical protein